VLTLLHFPCPGGALSAVMRCCSTRGEDTEGPAGRQEDLPPRACAGCRIGQETGGD